MTQMATITDQRQLTLPVALFHNNFFRAGEKVIVETFDDWIKITPAVKLVRKLAGSLSLPAQFKGLSIDDTIKQARKEHFQNKYFAIT